METSSDLKTQAWLAARLGKSTKTLEAWRSRGVGPAYVRVGRGVRYREADVDRWLAANTVGTRSQSVA